MSRHLLIVVILVVSAATWACGGGGENDGSADDFQEGRAAIVTAVAGGATVEHELDTNTVLLDACAPGASLEKTIGLRQVFRHRVRETETIKPGVGGSVEIPGIGSVNASLELEREHQVSYDAEVETIEGTRVILREGTKVSYSFTIVGEFEQGVITVSKGTETAEIPYELLVRIRIREDRIVPESCGDAILEVSPSTDPIRLGRTTHLQPVSSDIVLRNAGSDDLQIFTIAFEGGGDVTPHFAITDDDCASRTLRRGQQCAIAVEVRALQPFNPEALLVVNHSADDSPRSLRLTAAVDPRPILNAESDGPLRVVLSADGVLESVDFGFVVLNQRLEASMVLRNVGGSFLTVRRATITSNTIEFEVAGCREQTLGASARECEITLAFTPDTVGARSGELRIEHDGPASPEVITLTGNGALFVFQPRESANLQLFIDPFVETAIRGGDFTVIQLPVTILQVADIVLEPTGTPLVRRSGDFYEPLLASWEIPDESTLVLSLRDSVQLADGSLLTADRVASRLSGTPGLEDTRVEVVDDQTLIVTFARLGVSVLDLLADVRFDVQ